ncbi:MAG: sodium-dependent transporter [Paludibacter sp.]|nr:sodium-dependent transporter [Paludibacter sp.]MDD4197941.1 sodium-dependent transporter [Paludibacter sp.]MDD4427244.1 sodium-dependent transporter [Paludibacter sp.]
MPKGQRINFSSKLAVVAAAAGSAVGLGNIWRFPYELGQYGGAAFLIIYLVFVVLIGMPVMLSEFVIGRMGQSDAVGSFKKLAPKGKWWLIGVMGVLTSFLIMGFYAVVAGWTLEYIYQAVANQFVNKDTATLTQVFVDFCTDTWRPLIWLFVFMIISAIIIMLGVKDGIEKSTKFLMPLLFIIIVALGIRAVTLPGGVAGLKFLFQPDFSKITSGVILSAMGQAFFSLSLGMGCMITYGSYISKKNHLSHTVVEVSLMDTLIAVLAAVAIFPAVFSLGINPGYGPELVFITLPNVFAQMPGGYVWSILFFILLCVAALTSAISLMEVVVAYLVEEIKIKRLTATIWVTIIILFLGVLASLSFGVWKEVKIFNMGFFDLFDNVTSKVLMPIGGLMISVFTGWVLSRKQIRDEISTHGRFPTKYYNAYIFLVRYITPIGILFVILNQLGLGRWLGLS